MPSYANECHYALKNCMRHGLFDSIKSKAATDVMKFNQWCGDAVLAVEVRSHLYDTSKPDTTLADMAKWAQHSCRNETLAALYDEAWLSELFPVCAGGKFKADKMEMIIWMIHEQQQQRRWGGQRQQQQQQQWQQQARMALAQETLSVIIKALTCIGWGSAFEGPAAAEVHLSGSRAMDEARNCLRQFQCDTFGAEYTHSSLRGQRDWCCRSTGRLQIPDTEEASALLWRHVLTLYNHGSPLCWVEMATPRYPFFEDIDVMGAKCSETPPSHILDGCDDFWSLRAFILNDLFPDVQELELTLFVAHGWNAAKACWKASYHALWRDIIVDQARANVIRCATIEKFNDFSAPGKRLAALAEELLAVDERNTWDNVFDRASVRCGSFRLPFNDKADLGGRTSERRPILPCGVWRLSRAGCWQTHKPRDLSDTDWLRRGSVRVPAPTPLARYRPPTFARSVPRIRPAASAPRGGNARSSSWTHSSSSTLWERRERKELKQLEEWDHQQQARRRCWRSTPEAFNDRINEAMEDSEGHASTFLEISAKPGKRRYIWQHKRMRGAVEVQDDGEVFIRGNAEQQLYLLELVRHFTDEWTGAVPQARGQLRERILRTARLQPAPDGGVASWLPSTAVSVKVTDPANARAR